MPIGIGMGTGMAIAGGLGLVGSYLSAQGAQNAAQTQANAGAAAQNQLLQTGANASQAFTPYQDVGTTALSNITGNLPYFTNQFNNQDLNANLAPNYQFMLGQGQQATNAAQNATGGLVGGNAQQALDTYTQNYAQNAYQNAFNNYQAQRQNVYGNLSNLAGIGLQGAGGYANAQLGTGTNIAGVTQGVANANAASQIAQSQAYSGGAQNAGNLYMLSSLINGKTANPYAGNANGTNLTSGTTGLAD